MKLPDEVYERIERYLLQEMTAEEAATFEADCSADPDLAAALSHEKKVHLLIRIHNQNQIRQQVRALDSARKPRILPFRRMVLVLGPIAAILLLVIGYWWMAGTAEMTGNQLADSAEERFATAFRGSDGSSVDSLQSLMQQENWTGFAAFYLQLPDSVRERPWARLMYAQADYKQARYAQADSLAALVMGPAANASSDLPCKAKLLRVFVHLRREKLKDAKALIGYTPGSTAWKVQWQCLKAAQHEELERLGKELAKKLP